MYVVCLASAFSGKRFPWISCLGFSIWALFACDARWSFGRWLRVELFSVAHMCSKICNELFYILIVRTILTFPFILYGGVCKTDMAVNLLSLALCVASLIFLVDEPIVWEICFTDLELQMCVGICARVPEIDFAEGWKSGLSWWICSIQGFGWKSKSIATWRFCMGNLSKASVWCTIWWYERLLSIGTQCYWIFPGHLNCCKYVVLSAHECFSICSINQEHLWPWWNLGCNPFQD